MSEETETLQDLADRKYKYGFVSDIESDYAPKGLNEEVIRFISAKKNEPDWMLDYRLSAYRRWLTLEEPGMGQAALSQDRLPGRLLLRRAEKRRRQAEIS